MFQGNTLAFCKNVSTSVTLVFILHKSSSMYYTNFIVLQYKSNVYDIYNINIYKSRFRFIDLKNYIYVLFSDIYLKVKMFQ